MSNPFLLAAAIPALLVVPISSAQDFRQADLTGSGERSGNGSCTLVVNVDHSARIEVSADRAQLTTLAGRPASWRRFECNRPLPSDPFDFRLAEIRGRGTVRLLQSPRNSGGTAVIHISDRQAGSQNYSFKLQWRGAGTGGGGPMPHPGSPGGWPWPGNSPTPRVIRACQDSVSGRLTRSGYWNLTFGRTNPVNTPGPYDRVTGVVSGYRGYETAWFSYSCSVDFSSATVRSVDVRRR